MTINMVEQSPWSNDEINLRVNMLTELLLRTGVSDDINRISLQREIATWRELMKRREQSPILRG